MCERPLPTSVSATNASLHSTIGLSGSRGLLITAAMGLVPIMVESDMLTLV